MPDSMGLTVAAAGGTLADGIVVYGSANQVAVAHARAADVTGDAPERMTRAIAATDGDGRIALAWTDTNIETHARILKPGAGGAAGSAGSGSASTSADEPAANLSKLLPPAKPGFGFAPTIINPPCLAADRGWLIISPDHVFGFGGTRPVVSFAQPGVPLGCAAGGIVFRIGHAAPQYQVCDDTCTTGTVPGAPDFSSVAVVDGKLIAVALHGGALAVWHQDSAAPTFYGLPEPMRLVHLREWPLMALTDGKSLDVLARGATGYFVIRVPVK
jgi:hypothetical protein